MKNNTNGGSNDRNLTFEEEVLLSKKIQAGTEAKEILEGRSLLPEEEREKLNLLVAEGKIAFEQLVNANVPRAMKYAYETWRKNQYGVNDLEDYQQVALKVICACARTFDWKKGFRFGTYVHHCLQHEMLRENARTCYALRIPEENLVQLNTAKQNHEVSACGDKDAGRSVSDKLSSACTQGISLQAPLGTDENDMEFGELLPDMEAVTAEQIEEMIDNENGLLRLREALEALPEDEKQILKARMGFFGKPMPLKSFVGTVAKSISGVQKKQIMAMNHLKELYNGLPMAG